MCRIFQFIYKAIAGILIFFFKDIHIFISLDSNPEL